MEVSKFQEEPVHLFQIFGSICQYIMSHGFDGFPVGTTWCQDPLRTAHALRSPFDDPPSEKNPSTRRTLAIACHEQKDDFLPGRGLSLREGWMRGEVEGCGLLWYFYVNELFGVVFF